MIFIDASIPKTVADAEGAFHKRVTRGNLEHDKEDDGRVYVYLDVRDRRRVDDEQDAGVDPNSNALISQLRDEVAYLRDENRRKDEIIMQQALTMRQLSAAPSQEPQKTPRRSRRPRRVRRSPGPLRARLRKPESAAGGSSGDKGRHAGRKESKGRR